MVEVPSLPRQQKEISTLGGGCFWCIEAAFDLLEGVETVKSGYMGGKHPNPSYEAVCTGITGHAEVVQITFNPSAIPYQDILRAFFSIHDPTMLNRQGNDIGTQYRSVIFYHSPEQETTAKEVITSLNSNKIFDAPIVTEISPTQSFYLAEDYHQEYFFRNPLQPYCSYLISPKIEKFRKQFETKLKT